MRHRSGPGNDSFGGGICSNSIGGGGGSFDGSVFKDKPRKRGSFAVPPFVKNPLFGLVTSVFFAALALNYRWQQKGILKTLQASSVKQAKEIMDKMRDEKKDIIRQLTKAKGAEKQTSLKIQNLEKQQKVLQTERDNLKKKALAPTKTGVDPKAEARERELLAILYRLQNATQKSSKNAILEKFGNGPHRVEFSLILPSDESESIRTFIVEMAPLDIMPHAQLHFLEQVHAGLWNAGWFYVNGPHVLQCGPQVADGIDLEDDHVDDREVALKPFRDRGLENLHFTEFSTQYPHEKWTLGMTGRPGGPDWYINKQDNTIGHGPGGQSQYPLSDMYGDPCFAKVVSGFETLERIFSEPTLQSGEYKHFFEEPVSVKEAKIVSPIVPKIQQLPIGQQQMLLQGAQQQLLAQQQALPLQQPLQQQLQQGIQMNQGVPPQQGVAQQQLQQNLGQQQIVTDPLLQQALLQQQQQQQQPIITDPVQQALLLQQQQQQAIVTDPVQQSSLLQQKVAELNANVRGQGEATATVAQNAAADGQQDQSSSSSSFVQKQPPGQEQQAQEAAGVASANTATTAGSKTGPKDGMMMKELMMARRFAPLTVDP